MQQMIDSRGRVIDMDTVGPVPACYVCLACTQTL